MEALDIVPNLAVCPFSRFTRADRETAEEGTLIGMGVMPNGTSSGSPAVVVLIELEGGRKIIAQTTLTLFHGGSRALFASPAASEWLP